MCVQTDEETIEIQEAEIAQLKARIEVLERQRDGLYSAMLWAAEMGALDPSPEDTQRLLDEYNSRAGAIIQEIEKEASNDK